MEYWNEMKTESVNDCQIITPAYFEIYKLVFLLRVQFCTKNVVPLKQFIKKSQFNSWVKKSEINGRTDAYMQLVKSTTMFSKVYWRNR